MKPPHIHLLSRLLLTLALTNNMAASTLGGIFKGGASASLPDSNNRQGNSIPVSQNSTTYDDKDKEWIFEGDWIAVGDKDAHKNQIHVSNTIGDQAILSIQGPKFKLIFNTGANYGDLDVYVDDVKIQTISQNNPETLKQSEWISPDLGMALHVIKFVHAGGMSANIDALEVEEAGINAAQTPTGDPAIAQTPTTIPSGMPDPGSTPDPSSIPSLTALPETPQSTSLPAVSTATSNPTDPSLEAAPQLLASVGTILVSAGQSIQARCVDAASPGATCQVSSGTYSETVTIDKSISLVCSGTCLVKGGITLSANNITLRGFEVTGRGITVKGQYNTIENNYVHDLTTVTNAGISLYNQSASHHITIRNNKIKAAYNSCIYIAGSNHLIEGNDCSFTKQPTGGDADCIRAFGFNQTIRRNSCHDIAYGAAGYNPAVGDYIDNAHIDGIQTWNFTGQGGALRDSLIEYNNIDLPSQGTQATAKGFQLAGVTGGSQTIDLTQPYPCRNITIRYNLVHFNLLGIFRYCEDMTVVNNTFIGDEIDTAAGFHILNSRGTNKFQYNIFCCKLKDAAFTPYDTESETSLVGGYNNIYQTNGVPVGKPWPGDLWDVDPQFVDLAARDYRLQPGSPACGMGAFPCQ